MVVKADLWNPVSADINLEVFYTFLPSYIVLLGLDGTQRLFRRHIKKLKDEQLAKRVAHYMEMLPDILHELVPDINTFTDRLIH